MPAEMTHKELAGRLGVSVTTIKSYRSRFPGAVVPLGRGKPLRFGSEALAACRAIRKGFERGLSIDDIYAALIIEFPWVEKNRRLSEGDDMAGPGAPSVTTRAVPRPPLAEAGDRVLAKAYAGPQDLAGETSRRLERLEAMLAELVAIGNRTHSLHAELLAKLDALAGMPGFAKAAAAAGPSDTPPREFMDLPVVVLSDRGEYLGITGPDGRPFGLGEFEGHLLRRAGRMDAAATFQAAWAGRGDGYVLTLRGAPHRQIQNGQEAAPGADSGHEHFFRRTTTRKGNLVALFHRLRINGKDVSEAFLRAFFKQIKDSLE